MDPLDAHRGIQIIDGAPVSLKSIPRLQNVTGWLGYCYTHHFTLLKAMLSSYLSKTLQDSAKHEPFRPKQHARGRESGASD